jgi:hypothetical protein
MGNEEAYAELEKLDLPFAAGGVWERVCPAARGTSEVDRIDVPETPD